MKKQTCKSVLSFALCALFLVAPFGFSLAETDKPGTAATAGESAAGEASVKNKSEVVYATLTAEGAVQSIYTVNHFVLREPGTLRDYGAYTTLTNLSGTAPLTQDGDAVTVLAETNDFYYQGDMASKELPWTLQISYTLDGKPVAPQALAGQAGALAIRIRSARNPKIDTVFYDHYMLQVSLALDSEYCVNLVAKDATIAEAGKNKRIAFTVMPGKDADYTVTADVVDFTMSGIEIAALPFSMNVELPDTAELTDQFTELSDAIAELDDGVGELADGTTELKRGALKLRNGSLDIRNGLTQLSNNAGSITSASSQIQGALKQVAASLRQGLQQGTDMSALEALPKGLVQIADGLGQVSGGMGELQGGFAQANQALKDAIAGIPEGALGEAQIMALYGATDPSQHGALDQLIANYKAAQTVKGTYAHVREAFDAVSGTLSTLGESLENMEASLREMATEIKRSMAQMGGAEQLSQLASGLTELSKNYDKFQKGLSDYMDGVKKASKGYASFHSGLAEFSGGVGELETGVVELHDGTGKLHTETKKLPDTMQEEIDKLMAEYQGSDFDSVSFVSDRNANVELVQFVIKCAGIEKPEGEAKTVATEAVESEGIWERVKALFR